MDYDFKIVFVPTVVLLALVGFLALVVWRHMRRQRKEGNSNPSMWGAFLPSVSKQSSFARMSMEKLAFALIKRVALLTYFFWAVWYVKEKIHTPVEQWVCIGLCGVLLTYRLIGGLLNRAFRDLGRCRSTMDFIVPAGEFVIFCFLSLILCWFYVPKLVYDIGAISIFMWMRKHGKLDDVMTDDSVEDKAIYGDYEEANDKELHKPAEPFSQPEASAPTVSYRESSATLEDGTVIVKDAGTWHERGDCTHVYKENFDGTFSEK